MDFAFRQKPGPHGFASPSQNAFSEPTAGTGLSEQDAGGKKQLVAHWDTAALAPRPAGQPPLLHVYELWPQLGGRNQFHCRGRCVTGPPHGNGLNIFAWVCIVVPMVVYYTSCAKYLWENVSPLLPMLTSIALVSSLSFMLLTSCTDPGIIPRHRLQLLMPGLADRVAKAIGTQPLHADPMATEPVCTLTDQETAIGYRWCRTCKVVRPPRASHCHECDNCVLRFDHHCPFVNNCVGQRNHGYFVGFVVSTSCLGLAVVSGDFICRSHYSETYEGAGQSRKPAALHFLIAAAGVPSALVLAGVVCFSCFHMYLVFSGRTTKEVLTGKGVARRGRTLSVTRGPSLVHFRSTLQAPLTCV